MLRPGTNVIEGEIEFSDYEKEAFVNSGFLKIVDTKNEVDNVDAIRHSTSKSTIKTISEKSKSKSVKVAAETKEKELTEAEDNYKKLVAEAKAKKAGF